MRLAEGLVTVFLILTVAGPGAAQTTTGSILGDITDPSGAVLPGVTVRVTSSTTGVTRETVTNAVGAYRFAGLQPAEYAVTVTLDGFRAATRLGVVLPVLGEIKIDFRMEVGQVTESITVTGETPLVQPTAHVTQTVIENARVQALPLRTRDYMDLALLSPGVVLDQSSVRNGSTDSISFFGMEESHKTIWLDGVDFNDEVTGGGTNISASTRTRLSLDAVQEFQVMSPGIQRNLVEAELELSTSCSSRAATRSMATASISFATIPSTSPHSNFGMESRPKTVMYLHFNGSSTAERLGVRSCATKRFTSYRSSARRQTKVPRSSFQTA